MDKRVNRRGFLKKSAALAAGFVGFPYIVRASALGKDGATAASNRLVMAHIGCGSMGSGHIRAFLTFSKTVQLVALCDVDDEKTQAQKRVVDKKYGTGDCKTYQDYRVLLDSESIDIVSHALPDHWHAPVTVACARKGIDMYGEKPFARSIREGRIMCDAIKRYGLVWQTGSWQRSVNKFHRAAELVRNGRIGKVKYVEVGLPDGKPQGPEAAFEKPKATMNWDLWLGSAPWRPYQNFNGKMSDAGGRGPHWDWRWILDYSGGEMTDWAGHHIDIAHWGLDLERTGPVEIEGAGKYPIKGIYDVPYAYDFTCKYENGVEMRVANKSALSHGMGACWYGETGWVHVNRNGLWASDERILKETIGPDETRLYLSRDHQQNFLDCVRSRSETIAPAEVGHRSVSVALLGEIAMQTGRKLKWNPTEERFVNDTDANRYLMRPYRSPWHL